MNNEPDDLSEVLEEVARKLIIQCTGVHVRNWSAMERQPEETIAIDLGPLLYRKAPTALNYR